MSHAIRIESDVYELLNQRKKDETWTTFLRKLLNYYLAESHIQGSDQIPTLKSIRLKYPADCTTCGESLAMGQEVLWGRTQDGKTVIVCLSCQINQEGDKTLIKLDRKRRQLERLLKAYQNQIEDVAKKSEECHMADQHRQVLQTLIEDHKKLSIWWETWHSKADKDLVAKTEEIAASLRYAMQYMTDFEGFMDKRFGINLRKKEAIKT